MKQRTIRHLLLVTIAIAGLVVASSLVTAHGGEQAGADGAPVDGNASDWATWMEQHMTEYMGPGSVEYMESSMGVSVEEMAEDMANGDPGAHCGGPGYPTN